MKGNERTQSKKKLFLIFSFVNLILQTNVWGVEVIPRIDVSETYNDNISLTAGSNSQDDYITQLNPGLNISSEGKRTNFLFDYRMQNIFYRHNEQNDDTYHQATLTTRSELLSNRFFIDIDGTFSQRNVGVSDSISFDNLSVDERNRSDVTTYRASPYYEQKIGKFAKLMLQYSEKGMDYEKNTSTILDSDTKTSSVTIANGQLFRKLSWRLTGKREKVAYDGLEEESLTEDSSLELRYKIGAKSYVIGVKGYENNQYPNSISATNKGGYWNAGVGWKPSKRTSMELTRGERYFGNTTAFSLSHEKSKMYWNLSYKEDVTTASSFEFELVDTGNEILTVPVATSEIFFSKALQIGVDLKSRRSTLAFNTFRFIREFQDSPGMERNNGASLKLRWKLQGGTHLNTSGKWLFNTFRDSSREDNVYDTSFGIEHQIYKTSTVELSYSNLRRKSESEDEGDTSDRSYKRNLLSLTARIYF